MRRITLDIWSHVPAGKQVESGYNYKLTAPKEAGVYTHYRNVAQMIEQGIWRPRKDGQIQVQQEGR